ncbi:MAG TPA: methyltransferase domain-containing protein, partial [Tepidisphaeraceae bacterium]|nr:methyltransferase domain-containing protein [Tepidisphaeraceae bacterium]
MKRPQSKPRTPKSRPTPPTHWGNVAEWYDQLVGEEGSEFHRHVIFPGVLRLLALQPHEPVLDVACGQGVFCRLLSQHGAKPTGIDASPELIKLARQRNSALTPPPSAPSTQHSASPDYLVGDARDLSALPADHFAAATCILAIQNIDKLPPVFQGISRVLAPLGRLVLVMMHPCFRSPKFTSWGWDEEGKTQYRRVDRYLLPRREPIITHPGKKTSQYTWSFHRSLQTYVKALRGANLLVDALEEWPSHKTSTSGPRAPAENVARQEIPMFLALRPTAAELSAKISGHTQPHDLHPSPLPLSAFRP